MVPPQSSSKISLSRKRFCMDGLSTVCVAGALWKRRSSICRTQLGPFTHALHVLHALHMLYTCFTCFTCFPHALWRHIWQQTVEKSICPVPLHMLIQCQLACGAFSMQCGTPTNALVHLARPTTNVRKWKYKRWKSDTYDHLMTIWRPLGDHIFFQIVSFEN